MRYKEIQHQKVFFNDTATTEIYALSLHDTLPIYIKLTDDGQADVKLKITDPEYAPLRRGTEAIVRLTSDRKSTRLNSSHANISYAVFCLKKNNLLQLLHYVYHRLS